MDVPSGTPTRDLGTSSTSPEWREILRHLGTFGEALEKQGKGIDEVRSAQKTMAIDISSLKGSHGDHEKSLNGLRDTVMAQGQKIIKIEMDTQRAMEKAAGVHVALSQTQENLNATLKAVQTSQNTVAGKAETIQDENKAQTESLRALKAVSATQTEALDTLKVQNVAQTAQLATSITTLEAVRRNLPALIALATIAATFIGKVLDVVITHMMK